MSYIVALTAAEEALDMALTVEIAGKAYQQEHYQLISLIDSGKDVIAKGELNGTPVELRFHRIGDEYAVRAISYYDNKSVQSKCNLRVQRVVDWLKKGANV